MTDPAPTAEQICPNFHRHCEAGRKSQTYWPAYKTEARENAHRQGFASDQGQCDWCNPPCPTCDTRHRRSDGWLARLALAAALESARAEIAALHETLNRIAEERTAALHERDAERAKVQAVEAELDFHPGDEANPDLVPRSRIRAALAAAQPKVSP